MAEEMASKSVVVPTLAAINTGLALAQAAFSPRTRRKSEQSAKEMAEEQRFDQVHADVDSSFRNHVLRLQQISPTYYVNHMKDNMSEHYDAHARTLPIDQKDAPHVGYRSANFNY